MPTYWRHHALGLRLAEYCMRSSILEVTACSAYPHTVPLTFFLIPVFHSQTYRNIKCCQDDNYSHNAHNLKRWFPVRRLSEDKNGIDYFFRWNCNIRVRCIMTVVSAIFLYLFHNGIRWLQRIIGNVVVGRNGRKNSTRTIGKEWCGRCCKVIFIYITNADEKHGSFWFPCKPGDRNSQWKIFLFNVWKCLQIID